MTYWQGLPDHLINITGLIYGMGNQPKPFLATVQANMCIEGFVEIFPTALGLEDHLSRLKDIEYHWNTGPEDIVVAALPCPISIAVEIDPYRGTSSEEEEDCRESN